MANLLYRVGHFSVRRRRFVVATWLTVLASVVFLGMSFGGETTDSLSLPGTESQQGFDLLEHRFPAQSGSETRVVFAVPDGQSLDDPLIAEQISRAMGAVAEVDGVTAAAPPSSGGAVSSDGLVGFGDIRYAVGAEEVAPATLEAVETALEPARDAGTAVEFGGAVYPEPEEAMPASELIGLGVAVVVFLDYALFVITRHRQNLAEGLPVGEAAARANATAGGAVVFAGMTVVIALSSLALSGMPFLTAMGLGAAATVAIAVVVAVTLLPALLGFAGASINRFRVPGLENRTDALSEGETLGSRWARTVTGHPVLAVIAGTVVMLLLAIPMASMRLGLPDSGTDPTGTTQRKAYDLLADGFGSGFNGPLELVVDLDRATDPAATIAQLTDALTDEPGVVLVDDASFNEARDTAVIGLTPSTGPTEEGTEQLIHRLRDDVIPPIEQTSRAEVSLTGSAAAGIDISERLASSFPMFIIMVIGLTMLLLMAVFRSILVPIKAAVAILLSIGAAFGVVVAIVQWGWLNELIGLDTTSPIVNFLPILMFSIVFGLSMDCEVFILSRIHEDYARTADAKGSVVSGISSSARVITAAALIMISVFGAFVLGDQPVIKMFGIGLSVAVFLDATVVRMVIVPAVMTLFDEAAWWLPRWLGRLIPDLDVDGEHLMQALEADDTANASATAAVDLVTTAEVAR